MVRWGSFEERPATSRATPATPRTHGETPELRHADRVFLRTLPSLRSLRALTVLVACAAACGGCSGSSSDGSSSSGSAPADAGPTPGTEPTRETLALFRPHTNALWLQTDTREVAFHFPQARYQPPASLPVAVTLDGTSAIAFYDPTTGSVTIADSLSEGARTTTFATRWRGARPFAGHFAGRGSETIGFFLPEEQKIVIREANTDSAVEHTFAFGVADGWPFAGDFDGDGRDGVGVYSPSTKRVTIRERAEDGAPDVNVTIDDPAVPALALPVVFDPLGAGKDQFAVFAPDTNRLLTFGKLGGGEAGAVEAGAGTSTATDTLGPNGYLLPLAGRFRAPPGADPEGFAWPKATPQSKGFDADKLAQIGEAAATLPTFRSLLVVRGGALVHETYRRGADPRLGEALQSVTKSIVSALAGIAIDSGAIASPDDLVSKYLPEYFGAPGEDPRKSALAVKHLLTMTSGLVMRDEAEWAAAVASPDPVKAVLDASFEATPGAKFGYSTGVAHVLGRVVERVMKESLEALAKRALFQPMGITSPGWFKDPTGNVQGGSGLVLRPRDLARVGELYLRKGQLGDAKILSPLWVQASTTAQIDAYPGVTYGAMWWLRSYAGKSAFEARGNGGQLIVVVPDRELVVVTTAKPDVDFATSDQMFAELAKVIEAVVAVAN